MKGLSAVFFLLIFSVACTRQERPPKGVLTQSQLVAVLTDIHIADGYTNSTDVDSLNKHGALVYRSIFRKHHTDSAGLRRSIAYYSLRPILFKGLYDQVKNNLVAIQKKHSATKKTTK